MTFPVSVVNLQRFPVFVVEGSPVLVVEGAGHLSGLLVATACWLVRAFSVVIAAWWVLHIPRRRFLTLALRVFWVGGMVGISGVVFRVGGMVGIGGVVGLGGWVWWVVVVGWCGIAVMYVRVPTTGGAGVFLVVVGVWGVPVIVSGCWG